MNLDIDALRSSGVVADHRNFTRAAGMVALFRKRPAITLLRQLASVDQGYFSPPKASLVA